jgi:hypothetical protein
MSKKFYITEQEKLYILKKYNLLKEGAGEGECIDGDCVNGKGKIKYKDGSTYEGPFKNGKPNGTGGITTLTNGDEIRIKMVDGKYNGYGVYEFKNGVVITGEWSNAIDENGSDTPAPKSGYDQFKVLHNEDYSYIGELTEKGLNGKGVIKINNDDNATYTGTFKQENFYNGQIDFYGTTPEGVEMEIPDLLEYHRSLNDVIEYQGYEKIIYTDENRKTFKGCVSTQTAGYQNVFQTDGLQYTINGKQYVTKDYGFQKDIPELGWAKYEGPLDGKQVKITRGCWSNFKLIVGTEEGERGNFEGDYYTLDDQNKLFSGDESKGNKFMYGEIENAPGYTFYDQIWKYKGIFKDGRIDTTEKTSSAAANQQKFPGQITFSDGNVYTGNFKDGQIDGQGVFTFRSGLRLSGNFKYNEESEILTYSVVLDNGQTIDDIFKYEINYRESEKKSTGEDIGILKSGTFRGKTFFNVDLIDGTETFNKKGVLPEITVIITNIDNENINFRQVSDENGSFTFEKVPYGNYSLEATIGGSKDISLSVDSFSFQSELKEVRLNLKPSGSFKKFIDKETKKLKEFGQIKNFSKLSPEETKKIFIDSIYEGTKESTWVKDLIKGDFEKKHGTVNTEENCVNQLKNYADMLRKINKGEVNLETTKQIGVNLRPTKKFIQNCWRTYPKEMRKQKEDFLLVRNPGGNITDYAIVLENSNKQDIYNKNSMGLNNTISKVILEHKEKKNLKIQENKIIKNRLNFVLTENKDSILNLIKEKNILLNKGYDSELIDKNYNLIINKRFRNVGGE